MANVVFRLMYDGANSNTFIEACLAFPPALDDAGDDFEPLVEAVLCPLDMAVAADLRCGWAFACGPELLA